MTTATDWDVRDRETNDQLDVTDVQAALSLDGAATDAPVLTAERAQRLAELNTELAGRVGSLSAEMVDLRAENDRLQAELATLRAELHPLDARRTGWTPRPSTMPARHWSDVHGVDDLTEQQQRAALVAPTLPELRDGDGEDYLGAAIAAEIVSGVDAKPGWPTWLGQVHHADAAWADIVTRLRAMPGTYAAPPMERTVVEPVEVDTSYRETEAWALAEMVVSQSRHSDPGVYGELAPERLDEQALVPTGAPERHDPPRRDDEPDRSDVERMTQRVNGGLRTLGQPQSEVGASEPTSKSEPPRVGGWRTWAKSIGLGAAMFGALAVWWWMA